MTTKRKSEHPEGESEAPAEVEQPGAGEEEAESASGNGQSGGEVAIEVEPAEGEGEGEPGEGGAEPPPEERIAALEQEKQELEKKAKESYERFLRASADLENYRKRARRDVEDARVDARSRVLKEMLPVIDNLERAVSHAEGTEADTTGIYEGVTLVLRQFSQALERCDVAPIDALEKPFDPNIHEAVGQHETDEHPPGTVVQVLQKGYTIGERLLRPSLVVVSKAASQVERAPAEPDGGADGAAGEGSAAGDGSEGGAMVQAEKEKSGNGEDRPASEGNGKDRGGAD